METPDCSNSRKYGVPFYAAAWLPSASLKYEQEPQESENDRDQSGDDENSANEKSLSSQPTTAVNYYVAAAGGGGEGRSGISNALILAHFDLESRTLSDQPVSSLSLFVSRVFLLSFSFPGNAWHFFIISSMLLSEAEMGRDNEFSSIVDSLAH